MLKLDLDLSPQSNFRGSNWYTTDDYLESLKIPSSIKIVVMVNASQILNQKNISKAVKLLFKSKIKIQSSYGKNCLSFS